MSETGGPHHTTVTTNVQGFVARCACGWRGERRINEANAHKDAREHAVGDEEVRRRRAADLEESQRVVEALTDLPPGTSMPQCVEIRPIFGSDHGHGVLVWRSDVRSLLNRIEKDASIASERLTKELRFALDSGRGSLRYPLLLIPSSKEDCAELEALLVNHKENE